MQIAITRPLAANRTVRTAAAVLVAAAAATGVVAASTGGFSSGISDPPKASPVVSPTSDLSLYDGATLRHYGVKAFVSQQPAVQPTAQQIAAANRFHHGR